MKEHIRLRQDAARHAGSGFPEYLMGQLLDAPLKPVGSPLGLRVTSDFTLQFSLQFTNLQANHGLRRQVDGQQARRALQWPADTITWNRVTPSREDVFTLVPGVVVKSELSGKTASPSELVQLGELIKGLLRL